MGLDADRVFRHVDALHMRSYAIEFDRPGDLAFARGFDVTA